METAADYRDCLQKQGEWGWIEVETKRLGGEEAFYEFRGQILLRLSNLKVNSFYDISKISQANRDMFIKICCEFLLCHLGVDYRINKLANKIYHDEATIFSEKRKAMVQRRNQLLV
jgi:hypothetical protein